MVFKSSGKYNPYFDPKTDNMPIPVDSQKVVNTPIEKSSAMDDQDTALVNLIVSLVESKKINLYSPSTLINQEVYGKLSETTQGEVDQHAFNMLTSVREIYDYYKSSFSNNAYQFENRVRWLRLQKENAEREWGDVFVI